MESKVDTTSQGCSKSKVHINVDEVIEQSYVYKLSDEMNKISFSDCSMILKILITEHAKAYYLAYFDSNLDFHLYDISNYDKINNKIPMVTHIGSISVKGYWPFNMDYKECSDLDYDLKRERFYMLWQDKNANQYVAFINARNLASINSTDIVLSASNSGKLKIQGIKPSRFEFLFDQFVMFYNETKDIEFFAYNFIEKRNDITTIRNLTECMQATLRDKTSADYSIGDILFEDEYLFITDLNYGIFVVQLKLVHSEVMGMVANTWYLYALTSGPNQIHLERIDNYRKTLCLVPLMKLEKSRSSTKFDVNLNKFFIWIITKI